MFLGEKCQFCKVLQPLLVVIFGDIYKCDERGAMQHGVSALRMKHQGVIAVNFLTKQAGGHEQFGGVVGCLLNGAAIVTKPVENRVGGQFQGRGH